jgi:hypothetical protein
VDVIGAAAQILMLFVFLSVMFIPGYIRTYWDHRKGIHKTSHKQY